eukprot:TRINITY_DN7642_c0_g1_i1.p1 TRINITY_DN7642_c0_g1~~TRINITY_DN7642_c0_g1_i1.p1  ORF type:complete len:291 (-),score=45.51 TRINITY_DN7642_c0_g1_i1:10-882(-)
MLLRRIFRSFVRPAATASTPSSGAGLAGPSQAVVSAAAATKLPPAPQSFYRRSLPSFLVAFSSKRGRKLFQEALLDGHMGVYFRLAEQFQTQSEPAYCGIGTLIMVLNALALDPNRRWKGPWRWYSEEMLEGCVSLEKVKTDGITFDEFLSLSECNAVVAEGFRPAESSLEHFRAQIKRCTAHEDTILVANFSRSTLEQTGSGHFSPVAGYHAESDSALLLDVARFKYPPYWVPVPLLWKALAPLDSVTNAPRGFILVRRRNEHDEAKPPHRQCALRHTPHLHPPAPSYS